MVFYLCELFDKDGKIIEKKHIEVKVGGVEDATKNEKVQALKKKATQQGLAFRVKLMEDS